MYKRIKELRIGKGLSQRELAQKFDMSQEGYSKYETGRVEIPVSMLIKLAKFYKVRTDYILDLED